MMQGAAMPEFTARLSSSSTSKVISVDCLQRNTKKKGPGDEGMEDLLAMLLRTIVTDRHTILVYVYRFVAAWNEASLNILACAVTLPIGLAFW